MRDIINEFLNNNKAIILETTQISANLQKVEIQLGATVTCYDKSIESDFLYYEIQVTKNYKPAAVFGFIGIYFHASNMIVRNFNYKESTAFLITNISLENKEKIIDNIKVMKDTFFDFIQSFLK